MYNDPNLQSNRRTKKLANSFGIPKADWNTAPTLPSGGYFNQPKPQKATQGVGATGDIQQNDVNILNKLYGKPTATPGALEPPASPPKDSNWTAMYRQRQPGLGLAPDPTADIPVTKPEMGAPPAPGPRPGPSPYADNDNGSTMFGMAGDTSAMLPHMNPYSMKSGAAMSPEQAAKLTEIKKQTAAMNDLRAKMSPDNLQYDIASGQYSTPDPKDVAAAEARYLAEQGPTGRQFAEGTNTQSARMQENREGAMARAENPSLVPYGARNAVGPMSGEGELRRQQAIQNPARMSDQEALAGARADVDAMKKTRDANSAEMKSRSGPGAWDGPIENPNQMRKDLQTTTDAYSIYKRRGGDMDFRTWANVHDSKTTVPPDVKRQLAHNYPGIWDGKTKDGDAAAGTDYDTVAASDANPTKDKLQRRREALLALQGGQTAQIANAVAHGANPQQAYATLQNQSRQDDIRSQQLAYSQGMQERELENNIDVAKAGRVGPDEQAAADMRARKNAAQAAYASGMASMPAGNQAARDSLRNQIEQIYGVTLDRPGGATDTAGAAPGTTTPAAGDWKQKFQDSPQLTNDLTGWKQFADNIGGDTSAIKEASEYSKFDVTPEKARAMKEQMETEATAYADSAITSNFGPLESINNGMKIIPGWAGQPGDAVIKGLREKYKKEYYADKGNLVKVIDHTLSGGQSDKGGKQPETPNQNPPTAPPTPPSEHKKSMDYLTSPRGW